MRHTSLAWITQLSTSLPPFFLSPFPLNRKSMFIFLLNITLLSLSLWCFLLLSFTLFFWSLHHSDVLTSCLLLVTFLWVTPAVLHYVWLLFPLHWMSLTSVSLCGFLLSLVSMGTVPGCHGDSAGRVMLSHVGGSLLAGDKGERDLPKHRMFYCIEMNNPTEPACYMWKGRVNFFDAMASVLGVVSGEGQKHSFCLELRYF